MLFSVFLVLVAVLSLDTFTAGLSYGMEKVKVPFSSLLITAFISGLMLSLSLWAGSLFLKLIPPWSTRLFSFLVLFLLSLYQFYDTLPCFHRKSNELTTGVISKRVNKRDQEVISATEALLLSLALSIDSISAGLCTGILPLPFFLTFLITALIHFAAFCLGLLSGRLFARKYSKNFSWLGGVVLMLLAFSRLF